jgi:hypothetical protein
MGLLQTDYAKLFLYDPKVLPLNERIQMRVFSFKGIRSTPEFGQLAQFGKRVIA